MSDPTPKKSSLPGYAVLGAFATGVFGLVAAVAVLGKHGDPGALPGLCLLASALAFGLLVNAFYRD